MRLSGIFDFFGDGPDPWGGANAWVGAHLAQTLEEIGLQAGAAGGQISE